MIMRKLIISILTVAATLPVSAQFNQSISVDGKYVPEVFRLDRINSFPKQVRFSLEKKPLAYDAKSVPAGFAPSLLHMPATGWRDTRAFSASRGYLELGAGSWLNSTLSAGYRFVDDKNTTIGVRLQHNSTSLWKPDLAPAVENVKMKRYDESIGLFGSHDFENKGRLIAAVDWHIGYFNYYGYNPSDVRNAADMAGKLNAPTQTLNDIAARIGWQSPDKNDDITWNAQAGVRYFGYRSDYYAHYGEDQDLNPIYNSTGGRETNINIQGGVNFPTTANSSVGIDLDANAYIYPGKRNDYQSVGSSQNYSIRSSDPDSYGVVTLSPYYNFSRDRLLVHIGAQIDLAFNAGETGNRYGFFHIAPDVRLDYLAGPVSFYLHALGGCSPNTLAANYEDDYYQQPFISDTELSYTPLDGRLGVNFGPFSGFSAGVEFAFRIANGNNLAGWYTTYLNYGTKTAPGLPVSIDDNGVSRELIYTYDQSLSCNLHGFSLGANLKYDLGRIIKIEAKGNYQPQNGEKGYFNGLDRPRITANISAETNPWNRLKFKLAYDYRGVRNIYTVGYYRGGLISDATALVSRRLPDITSLNFGVSYGITDHFNIWLQADNLLNRHVELLPRLPQQGIRFAGGFGVTF